MQGKVVSNTFESRRQYLMPIINKDMISIERLQHLPLEKHLFFPIDFPLINVPNVFARS